METSFASRGMSLMGMRTVSKWTLIVLVAAVVSVPLALKLEGISYQLCMLNGTPGMLVANRLVPSSSDHGMEAMAKAGNISLAVDAPL